MSTLLFNLVSGLVGALIGALALAAIQGWQLLVARRDAKAAGRLIYLEITFNIAALRAGQTTTPARLLVSTQMWDQHSARIIGLLGEVDMVRVAAPYLQIQAHREFFQSGPLELARPRAWARMSKSWSGWPPSTWKQKRFFGPMSGPGNTGMPSKMR